jgi:hypothetical protein
MNRLRTLFSLALFATLAACGGGSGGSGSPSTPNVPTPVPAGPATHTVIDLRNFSLRGQAGVFYNQDKLPEGSLDITMEWENGDIPVSVYVTAANSCPDTSSLRSGGCQILAQSVDPKTKPKRITYNVAAGKPSLAVWVINEGRQGTSGSVEVGITSTEKPATPDPSATPNPDLKSTLPDGPVAIAFIKVRSIDMGNKNYRDPFTDKDGYWVLHQGEIVVFDLTQKNAGNQECKWVNDPTWDVDDPGFVFIIRGSSQPFLLRADVDKAEGFIDVQAHIDGVASNILKLHITKPN